jgi:nucleotide-binding universal stress UspA family protein
LSRQTIKILIMKKILIPTDLSILGQFAYDLAAIIASKTGATIDLLSIVPGPQEAIYDDMHVLRNDEGEDYSEWFFKKEEMSRQLENWVKDKPFINSYLVKIGRIEEDIVYYAENNAIDLIVMGTDGATGLKQLFHGSHTEKISNTSAVPVLSLKCDRSNLDLNEIVLAGDFQDEIKMDLSVLKSIQTAFHSKIVLLRINTTSDFDTDSNILNHMKAFVELNGLTNVDFSIYNGTSVEAGIVEFCNENRIDLIALGTHQYKGIRKLFRQNISEDIVNHIYHPILTFPIR